MNRTCCLTLTVRFGQGEVFCILAELAFEAEENTSHPKQSSLIHSAGRVGTAPPNNNLGILKTDSLFDEVKSLRQLMFQ